MDTDTIVTEDVTAEAIEAYCVLRLRVTESAGSTLVRVIECLRREGLLHCVGEFVFQKHLSVESEHTLQ